MHFLLVPMVNKLCCVPCPIVGDGHDGTLSQTIFGLHCNQYGDCLQPRISGKIFPFGITQECLLIGGLPRDHGSLKPVCQNLDPLKAPIWFFSGFWIRPRRKVTWSRKFFGPEGVLFSEGGEDQTAHSPPA